jgi:hypothetical protein
MSTRETKTLMQLPITSRSPCGFSFILDDYFKIHGILVAHNISQIKSIKKLSSTLQGFRSRFFDTAFVVVIIIIIAIYPSREQIFI